MKNGNLFSVGGITFLLPRFPKLPSQYYAKREQILLGNLSSNKEI